MNRLEWTELVLKLFSIYLLVGLISDIPGYFYGYINYGNKDLGYWLGAIFPALLVVFIFVLIFWFFSQEISNRLWSDIEEDESIPSLSGKDIHYAIFSGIGIYICVTTIPHLIALTSDVYQKYSMLRYSGEQVDKILWFNIIAMFIKLAFGIWLLFGSRKIVQLLRNLQNYGLEKR